MRKNEYEGMTKAQLQSHIIEIWNTSREQLESVDILWAVRNEVSGYEENAWFLLCDKETGELFEVSCSHCSCHGFEDQWKPEPTTVNYLLSKHFWASGVDPEEFQAWALNNLEQQGEKEHA